MNTTSELSLYLLHRARGRRLLRDETHPRYSLNCDYIVTGPEPEVLKAVEEARNKTGLESILVDKGLVLDDMMRSFVGTGPEFPWFSDMNRKHPLVMQLYRTRVEGPPDDPDLSRVEALVDSIRTGPYGKNVYADLDYLLDGVSGDPWTGEGSPWTGEGSPWTGEGSPWTGEGSPWNVSVKHESEGRGAAEARSAFKAQWALGSDQGGIGLIKDQRRSVRYRGRGVRVGIFDTSPESLPGQRRYDWVAPSLKLRMEQLTPLSVAHGAPPEGEDLIRTPWAAEDHGLFVAGLIHGIAPKSDIRLYRVLDGERTGDLFTLNYALYTFIKQVLEDRGKLKGAVINLSLGCGPLSMKPYSPGELERSALEPHSLHLLLTAARKNGIVIAAAAGNKRNNGNHAPPQNPAFSPDCLSVEASNCQGDRADFSCKGVVCAPGGCVPGGTCRGSHPEELASQWLMSLIWRQPRLEKWREAARKWWKNPEERSVGALGESLSLPPGYAYAAGTSFSTPLVSGLAALMFDAGARGPIGNREWIGAQVVYDSIKASMGENGGVIHVPTAIKKALAAR